MIQRGCNHQLRCWRISGHLLCNHCAPSGEEQFEYEAIDIPTARIRSRRIKLHESRWEIIYNDW
jgi:hypothetical protein